VPTSPKPVINVAPIFLPYLSSLESASPLLQAFEKV
jgi:hypothetical protein